MASNIIIIRQTWLIVYREDDTVFSAERFGSEFTLFQYHSK